MYMYMHMYVYMYVYVVYVCFCTCTCRCICIHVYVLQCVHMYIHFCLLIFAFSHYKHRWTRKRNSQRVHLNLGLCSGFDAGIYGPIAPPPTSRSRCWMSRPSTAAMVVVWTLPSSKGSRQTTGPVVLSLTRHRQLRSPVHPAAPFPCIQLQTFLCMYTHTYRELHVSVCLYVCMYVCIYIYVSLCAYIYIYIYTYHAWRKKHE